MNSSFNKELFALIKERRSIRSFNGKKVAREDILSIIHAGIWAPTGCNNQELRFLILDDQDDVNHIVEFKPFFKFVSTCVLIFCDMSLPMSRNMYYKCKFERHLPYIDTGLALGSMILYAKSKGIDSCIFNLSEYHFKKSTKPKGFITKIINKIRLKLGLHASMENNFEFYLRNHLRIPKNLKIMCGVVFGFAKEYPDIRTANHGGKKIMRDKVEHYVINF